MLHIIIHVICTEWGVSFFISFLSFYSSQMTQRRCVGIVRQLLGKFKPAVSCLWHRFFCFSSSDGFGKNGCWTQTPGFMWNTEIRTMQDISDCFFRTKVQFPSQSLMSLYIDCFPSEHWGAFWMLNWTMCCMGT